MEDTFFGCPVLKAFISISDQELSSGLMGDEWEGLKERAEAERPRGRDVINNAILTVAFSLEELAFTLARMRLGEYADALRLQPGPIREPDDLIGVFSRLETISDEIGAEVIQRKLMEQALDTGQIQKANLEKMRVASKLGLEIVVFLKEHWYFPRTLFECGEKFGMLCRALSTPFDRRLSYAKGLLGEKKGL